MPNVRAVIARWLPVTWDYATRIALSPCGPAYGLSVCIGIDVRKIRTGRLPGFKPAKGLFSELRGRPAA